MDHFAHACGATGPLRFQVENLESGEVAVRAFDQPYVLVGREAMVDLVLDHPKVSRRHAFLQLVFGHLFWVDLGSRSGTFLGKQAAHSGWLKRDEALGFGPFRIRLLSGDQPINGKGLPADPLTSRTEGLGLLPEVTLAFTDGHVPRSSLPMRTVMALMGAEQGCKFRLLNVGVSRFHCSLLRTSAGLFVVDLMGRHGIRVNGSAARSAHLNDGDELQLGDLTVTIHSGPAHAPRLLSDEIPNGSGSDVHGHPAMPVRPEALPSTGHLAGPEINELATAIAMSLYNQFGSVQRQVIEELRAQRDQLDEFRDAVLQVDRLMAEEHRERLRLVRSEYEQIEQLTSELRDLKVWLGWQRPQHRPEPARVDERLPEEGAGPASSRVVPEEATPVEGTTEAISTAHDEPVVPFPPHVPEPGRAANGWPEGRPDPALIQQRYVEILNKRESLLQRLFGRVHDSMSGS